MEAPTTSPVGSPKPVLVDGGLDRKTFFWGLLLAIVVMLAGTFVVSRMLQQQDRSLGGRAPIATGMRGPPKHTPMSSSPHIHDVSSDMEGVNALAAGSRPKVVLVHAQWCGHCRNMMGAFLEAAATERSVQWIRIDSNVSPSVVQRSDLKGFPTIYGVDTDGHIVQHEGGRDVNSLLEFARKQIKEPSVDAQPRVQFADPVADEEEQQHTE